MSRTTARRTLMGSGAVALAAVLTVGTVELSASAATAPTSTPTSAGIDAAVAAPVVATPARAFSGVRIAHKRTAIAAPVTRVLDVTMPVGRNRVVREGKPGVLKWTYRQTWRSGHLQVNRLINKRVSVKPQAKLIKVGAKGASSRSLTRVPAGVNARMFVAAMKWADTPAVGKVRRCEAGGNYRLQDSPYYGAYQFLTSTWRGMGGGQFAPRADLAPSWAQDYVAYKLYVSQGWRPWTCARITGVA